MKLEIAQTLVLSTGHISDETRRRLEGPIAGWPACGGPYSEYGWFLYADKTRPMGTPDDLWDIMVFARQQGCQYVLLDQDGLVVEGLREYDW